MGFSVSEFLKMARAGRVYLIGSGENKSNPIHGADLAKVCVDAITGQEPEISVGGPEIYSAREIAELAFLTLGKKPKITRIPPWVANLAVKLIRPFNKHLSDLAQFFVTLEQTDFVAPATGTHTLKSHFEKLAPQLLKEK